MTAASDRSLRSQPVTTASDSSLASTDVAEAGSRTLDTDCRLIGPPGALDLLACIFAKEESMRCAEVHELVSRRLRELYGLVFCSSIICSSFKARTTKVHPLTDLNRKCFDSWPRSCLIVSRHCETECKCCPLYSPDCLGTNAVPFILHRD